MAKLLLSKVEYAILSSVLFGLTPIIPFFMPDDNRWAVVILISFPILKLTLSIGL
ncbi:hypothetical protein [Eubacterium sp.]